MSTAYKELLQQVVPRPIASDRAYKRALGQVEHLMRKSRRTRAEDDMIELLATLIEQYEQRKGHNDPVLSPREKLAGLIEARGSTAAEVARDTDIPPSTISEVLSGKRTISKSNAVRLAKYFDCALEVFIA